MHIITYLQNFLFSPDRARSPITHLSGGERNRLLLARLFTQPANLLVLDEPTNDLDLETLELLEELLVEFEGTLLLVSHDREFLDNVTTSTLAPGGRWPRHRDRGRLFGLGEGVAAEQGAGQAQEEEAPSPNPRWISRGV